MKKFLLLMGALIVLLSLQVYAQYEIRNVPLVLDPAKEDQVKDYLKMKLHSNHLKPMPLPEGADPTRKGPERLLSDDGFEIINISNANQFQSETWIHINPHDPDVIIAACNDSRYNHGNYNMASFTSTDRGKTWDGSITPNNLDLWISHPGQGGGLTNVDPGLGFDSQGNAYYVYLFAQLIGTGAGDNGVFVTKSTNNGKDWQTPYPAVWENAGVENQPLNDKCFMAVDHYKDSPYADKVYVVWYKADYPNSAVGFSHSEDGIEFSSEESIPGSTGSIQSPYPLVGPDGTLYVVWETKSSFYTTIYMQKSTNGGDGWVWTSPKKVQKVKTCGVRVDQRQAFPDKQNMRISSHPAMAMDPNNGNLYVVQAGKDDMDQYGVYLSISTDGGETWDANNRVDNNLLRNDMFMASIAVDPITGLIAIMYYSSQNVEENNGADVYVAVSFDQGETFEHLRISPESFYFITSNSVMPAGGAHLGYYWGDYSSIAAYNGRIYPCFWMPDLNSSPQSQTFWTNDIYTALIFAGPRPPQNVSFENTFQEPNRIVINWDDPETNMLGGPMNDFKVIISKDGEEIAEVDKGVETFTDNSLVDGEHFTYYLKTRIPSGQESNPVSISGVAGGALKPMPPTELIARPNENGILLSWLNPETHIDNSYFSDFEKVIIYDAEDETELATVDAEEMVPGQVSEYLLEVPVAEFYHIKMVAVGKRGDTETPSDFSETVFGYSGAPMTHLSESFDAETIIPYYTNGTWGITDEIAYDGEYSFTDSPGGNYERESINRVYFAPQVISEDLTTLSYVTICNVEENDIAAISVSNDHGKTWTDLRWYHMDLHEEFTGDLETSEWLEVHLSLQEYVGDTLYIQLYMETNIFKEEDGWYIDQLQIDDNPNPVNERIADSFTFKIYPNPSEGLVNIYTENAIPGDGVMECYDALGNKIFDIYEGDVLAGRHEYKLDFGDKPSGIYYIRYSLDGYTETFPVSIIK